MVTKEVTECRQLLEAQGFPRVVLDAWEEDGIVELLPIQRQAIDAKVLDSGSCIVIGPTSCGKTFIGEMACVKHARSMRPCLYLVPFKALAEEKYAEFTRKYGRPSVGANIVISTADRRMFDRSISKGEFDIAILTYEKLSSLIVLHPGILKNAGALIIDEIQMLADSGRGAGIELLITRAKQIAPELQLIGLSAVVSDLNGFDEWLGAKVISNDHRPVVLREGVMTSDGHFRFIEWQGTGRRESAETLHTVGGTEQAEMAVNLAAKLLENSDEQVLMFAETVRATQLLAQNLAVKLRSLPVATNALKALSQLEESESISALQKTLSHSVAFHNADLTPDERLAIERGFRSGEIRAVVSTSTLSMGVNMPASTVIISSPTKWAMGMAGRLERVPLSVAEYRNMSGRAGRFGLRKDSFGRSILTATSPLQQDGLVNTYVQGMTGPIESAFLKKALDTLLLQTFASGLCNSADGCYRFLLRTFAAKTAWATDSARRQLQTQVQSEIKTLVDYKLLAIGEKGEVTVTELGSICASSGLGTAIFAELTNFVRSANVSSADIAFIASRGIETGPEAVNLSRLSTDEYNARTALFVRAIREAITMERSPITEGFLDDQEKIPPYEEARALKFQAIALAFVKGIATSIIEDTCGVSGGKMRNIGSMCMWLCDTAAKISWSIGKLDEAKAYEVLADRFQYGCTEAALLLAQIPHRLHRAEREQLVDAGFTSLQLIIDSTAIDVSRTARIDKFRVEELQRGIISVIGESLELERQQLARLNSLGISGKLVEEVYTMKGLLLEQAIENILQQPFCPLRVCRISSQREGEADLRIELSNGRVGIAQVNAKDKPTDRVGITKAGAVLQQSPELNPISYICFGRPDFMDDAVKKAEIHVSNGKNYKLIPISTLAEMYVQFHEKRLTAERVAEILESETGYISTDRLPTV